MYDDLEIICSKYKWNKCGFTTGRAHRKTPIEWINVNTRRTANSMCLDCGTQLMYEIGFKLRPVFIRFRVDDVVVKWTPILQFKDCEYRLCGLIYYGNNHFVARIVTEKQKVLYNDGLTHGRLYKYEGEIADITLSELNIDYECYLLSMLFYIRV